MTRFKISTLIIMVKQFLMYILLTIFLKFQNLCCVLIDTSCLLVLFLLCIKGYLSVLCTCKWQVWQCRKILWQLLRRCETQVYIFSTFRDLLRQTHTQRFQLTEWRLLWLYILFVLPLDCTREMLEKFKLKNKINWYSLT